MGERFLRHKNNWQRFSEQLLSRFWGVGSLYTPDYSKFNRVPFFRVKEMLLAAGYRTSTYRSSSTHVNYELTTDPWEEDYSQSFIYPVQETSAVYFEDLNGGGSFRGNFVTAFSMVEELSLPFPIPVKKKIRYVSTLQANKLVKSKDFICESVVPNKPRLNVNVFYAPHFGYRISLSIPAYFKNGAYSDLVFPLERGGHHIVSAVKTLFAPLKKSVFSASVSLFIRNGVAVDHLVTDFYYLDGADFTQHRYSDALSYTQSICKNFGLKSPAPLTGVKISDGFSTWRHVDSRVYLDNAYIISPYRYICLYCYDQEFTDEGKTLWLATWSEEDQDWAPFSKFFQPKPKLMIKNSIPAMRYNIDYKDKLVVVLADTLTAESTVFKGYKVYPRNKSEHVSNLTLQRVLNAY